MYPKINTRKVFYVYVMVYVDKVLFWPPVFLHNFLSVLLSKSAANLDFTVFVFIRKYFMKRPDQITLKPNIKNQYIAFLLVALQYSFGRK